MVIPSNPSWHREHIRRLVAAGIQPHFMLGHVHQLESVERLIRRGHCRGPLILNYVAIGGSLAGLNPLDMMEFVRRVPDGAVLTFETLNRHVYPLTAMAIAMGMHVRFGIEDTLIGPHRERMTSVQQVEHMVQQARLLNRDMPTATNPARFTRSAGFTRTRTRPWHVWATRPTDGPANAARRFGAFRMSDLQLEDTPVMVLVVSQAKLTFMDDCFGHFVEVNAQWSLRG